MTEQPRYRIAVLGGTGAQGSGLALRLANAGHTVMIGSRDAAKARECAAELSGRLAGKTIAGDGNRQAAEACEIAILTVPYAVQQATVDDVRNEIAGKILIDATVPLVPPKVSVVQLPDGQSAVAAIQQRLGRRPAWCRRSRTCRRSTSPICTTTSIATCWSAATTRPPAT